MQPQFVHLRMHSEYSVTDSTVRLDDAIHKVKDQGVGALGLTDLNNIFGGLIFYTHARKAGVKPILGCDDGNQQQRKADGEQSAPPAAVMNQFLHTKSPLFVSLKISMTG